MTSAEHRDAVLEPDGYGELLASLKARVRATQVRAARAANTEVLRLYWSIGQDILDRQRTAGWGAKVVERLAADLKREFPDQRGWSRSNLLYMRRLAEAWPEKKFVQQAVGQLPWSHVTVLLDKLKTRDDRDWYAARAADQGWSRNVLHHHIATNLRAALGTAPTNFPAALDPVDSDLARQLVKDPYVFISRQSQQLPTTTDSRTTPAPGSPPPASFSLSWQLNSSRAAAESREAPGHGQPEGGET